MENQTENQAVTINSIIFAKPFTYEGKTYEKLAIDLESLTGQDLIDAEKGARMMGDKNIMLEASKSYQAVIAGKAAKVPTELILALPAKEFSKITTLVQNFLLE